MEESVNSIKIIFEEFKESSNFCQDYQEKFKNQELNYEITMLRSVKSMQQNQIEQLNQEIQLLIQNDLSKLNLNKDYEELLVNYKGIQNEMENILKNFQEKELLYKRQVYMLEMENQDYKEKNENLKQQLSENENEMTEMFQKLIKTGYGELLICNQNLMSRINLLEEKLKEQKVFIEKLKQQSNDELSRQAFNYEILVQQYQTLQREYQNLMRSQSNNKNYYQYSGQKVHQENSKQISVN